jgi:hypothetical protein
MILYTKKPGCVDGVDNRMSSAYLSKDAWLEPCLLEEFDGDFSRHNPTLVLACLEVHCR